MPHSTGHANQGSVDWIRPAKDATHLGPRMQNFGRDAQAMEEPYRHFKQACTRLAQPVSISSVFLHAWLIKQEPHSAS